MKILCYNKGTKEKETNKKCLKFSKKQRGNTDAQIGLSQRTWHRGCRDATKNKVKGGKKRYDSLHLDALKERRGDGGIVQ